MSRIDWCITLLFTEWGFKVWKQWFYKINDLTQVYNFLKPLSKTRIWQYYDQYKFEPKTDRKHKFQVFTLTLNSSTDHLTTLLSMLDGPLFGYLICDFLDQLLTALEALKKIVGFESKLLEWNTVWTMGVWDVL